MASPRRRIWIPWLVLGVAGVLAVVPAMVVGVRVIADTLAAPSRSIPGTVQVTLEAGDHVIFERTSTAGSTYSVEDDTTLTPKNVSITAPGSQPVTVRSSAASGTITQRSAVYRSALSFEAPEPGRYAVQVVSEPGAILITPSLGAAFGTVAPWLVGAALGALAALLGGIGFIVSLVRRSGAPRTKRPCLHHPPWPPQPSLPAGTSIRGGAGAGGSGTAPGGRPTSRSRLPT